MIVHPYEWQPESALSPLLGNTDTSGAEGAFPTSGGGSIGGNDAITRMLPPGMFDGGGNGSPFGAILQQLINLLQQLFGGGGQSGFPGLGGQQYFQNASGGSVGDPHLSFNGSTWDNMQSQPNLVSSDSFNGGFQISTQVTPPNQNGVTWNQSATITTNYGQTSVSLDSNGNPTVIDNGSNVAIAPGQTIDLGNGDTLTRNQNGSLQMIANDGSGGSITSSLTPNGGGVDVQCSSTNVDLGGALVNGPNGSTWSPDRANASGPHPPPEPIRYAWKSNVD